MNGIKHDTATTIVDLLESAIANCEELAGIYADTDKESADTLANSASEYQAALDDFKAAYEL